MNKKCVIKWKSKVNGRAGRGTKLFDQAEAQRLAEELNREYPQIEHEAVDAASLPQPTQASSDSEDLLAAA